MPVGSVVLAMLLAGCSTDAASSGAAGSPSAGGSPGSAGSPANPAGGTNAAAGSGASAGLGSPTAGSGGSAPLGGSAGSSSGGSGAGGGPVGGAGASGAPSTSGITVKLDGAHQTIQGFGLNDALLSSTWSTQTLDNLFTTTGNDGIGLQILRVGMNTSGGLNGTTASNLSGAKTRGAKIIGSCWSPPANCKSNGDTKNGGTHADELLRILVRHDRELCQEQRPLRHVHRQ